MFKHHIVYLSSYKLYIYKINAEESTLQNLTHIYHAGESIGLNVNLPGVKKVIKITFTSLITLGDNIIDENILRHKQILNLMIATQI